MKIMNMYYNKSGRLVKNKTEEDSTLIRFKILKNGKKFPCCDFKGKCTNFAYVEAFPVGKHVWYYLCKKHYYQEEKRYKWKLPVCFKVEW